LLEAARAAPQLAFAQEVDLPIAAHRAAILEALAEHQVLIVAGETGSGKSTQLPQYCLQVGRGLAGMIAHTQPRRLAARALAARIAEELRQPVGRSVGYRVRFADQVSDATRLLLMTDGLMLAELSADPLLHRYDTIIIDEAHERTLNVDLLLGVLRRLLPRRPDLKLIVTSATLDVQRVADFFDGAPVITVGGRGYPIEVRYLERDAGNADAEPDLPAGVLAAFQEIAAEPGAIGSGDVLVFLPGEREIRDVGELLERELASRVDVLPLYSRLSWDQQNRIFQRGPRQRIVLSTNVAETSITVPGIRSVIDAGLARVSRYSLRSRLQRLPIEPVSQASADQRKGRCGRLGAGLCLRLYSAAEFESRPPFTEPEVLRTNLAALLLRLAADGLGAAEEFPFIDPPDSRALSDGYRLLQELQALDADRRITRHGRAMARLPVDPRLARALLESQRFRAEGELLIIAAGLSVPDARIAAPAGDRHAARGAHATGEDDAALGAVFQDLKSEFSALVKLWRAYRRVRETSRRELKRWCQQRHFSLLRLSEWDDVYTQLVDRARDLGIVAQAQAASYAGVHRALLAGFCGMVGVRGEEGAYLGTRGVHFHIFPGSPLARRRPRWVMAANLVETSRVFARGVAEIEPKWIESAASHLIKREYLEPDWDETREEVVARERVGFLGLILRANRVVNYGPIAPEESRRIFAREALVHQRLSRRPEWLLANDAALRDAQSLEERLRTRDLLRSAESLVEFYDRQLPRQVSSWATLEHFARHLTPAERLALRLGPEQIFAREPDAAALAQFPELIRIDALRLGVDYRFAPADPADGATLKVPLLALPGLRRESVNAAIPGACLPRVEALLRSLPKEARRSLIPIAESAAAFLAEAGQAAADLPRLRDWLQLRRGVPPGLLRFDGAAVPAHLWVHVSVRSEGRELAWGSDLPELRRRCARAAQAELTRMTQRQFAAAPEWRRFEDEALPEAVDVEVEEGVVRLYPTLSRSGPALTVQLCWSAAEAAREWRDSASRLARSMLQAEARDLGKQLKGSVALVLGAAAYFNHEELIDAALQAVFRSACFDNADAPRTRKAFEAAVQSGVARLHAALETVIAAVSTSFSEASAVRRAQGGIGAGPLHEVIEESRAHLKDLVRAQLDATLPAEWLRHIPRYLKAEQRRWQRNAARGGEPASIADEIRAWTERLQQVDQQLAAQLRWTPLRDELRFWMEEYRVSLYAQELKTSGPVSAARLEQRAADVEAWIKR
jgi:ATP-dependent helicase HrpA